MAVKKNDKALLKKLKKQVRTLERKESQGRTKLRAALKKLHKLGRTYKNKLASKARVMKNKIANAQSSTYAKAAVDIERQLLKNIETKAKVLKSAITRFEKKAITKLSKNIAKKGKKSGTTPTRKSVSSAKVKSVRKTKKRNR